MLPAAAAAAMASVPMRRGRGPSPRLVHARTGRRAARLHHAQRPSCSDLRLCVVRKSCHVAGRSRRSTAPPVPPGCHRLVLNKPLLPASSLQLSRVAFRPTTLCVYGALLTAEGTYTRWSMCWMSGSSACIGIHRRACRRDHHVHFIAELLQNTRVVCCVVWCGGQWQLAVWQFAVWQSGVWCGCGCGCGSISIVHDASSKDARRPQQWHCERLVSTEICSEPPPCSQHPLLPLQSMPLLLL